MSQDKNPEELIKSIEQFMFPRMSKEALERYGRVKGVFPEVAAGALALAMRDIKLNKYQRLLDAQFKALLKHIQRQ